MIKGIIKIFTTKLVFGKAFDLIRSNFLITAISLLMLVSIFYVPYEYFNYLESKGRFPDDIFGMRGVHPLFRLSRAQFQVQSY